MITSCIDPIRGSHPHRRISGASAVRQPFDAGPAHAGDANRLALIGRA
jgi:hypothetical protein